MSQPDVASLADSSFKCVTLVSPEFITEQDGSPAQVTCLEALDHSIYVGTQTGDIIHFFETEPSTYIIASWQKTYNKRPRRVAGILLIPVLNTALTVSGSITSVFTLPEFAPCADVGSMRDVRDISRDVDEEIAEKNGSSTGPAQPHESVLVTVFTKNAIRVVAVRPDNLRVVSKIDYKGAVAGVRRSSYALVSNSASYDLIDITNNQKIPLVPVISGSDGIPEISEEDSTSETATVHSYNSANDDSLEIKPHIAAVKDDEFLITTGTKQDESAVGIFINTKGDITRGTLAFSGYPTSIAVDYPYVGAAINNDICIYSIITQELIQIISFDSIPMIKYVYSRHTVQSESLAATLKLVPLISTDHVSEFEIPDQKRTEFTVSSSLFIYSKNRGIQCLVPDSNINHIESLIIDGNMTAAKRLSQEHSAQVTRDFIHLMIALGEILNGQYSEANESWLKREPLDPRILVYLFDESDIFGQVYLPSGAKDLVDTIRSRLVFDRESLAFYFHFLSSWLKDRNAEKLLGPDKLFCSLEMAMLRLILDPKYHKDGFAMSDENLSDMIEHGIISSFHEAVEILLEYSRYAELAKLYENRKMSSELLNLWKKLLTKELHDDRFSDDEIKMHSYLTSLEDEQLVWEYGMWLVEKFPDLGISLFIDSNVTVKFDEERVINKLRSLSVDGPWRKYLRYLTYEQKSSLFVADLITFVIDDIVQKIPKEVEENSEVTYAMVVRHEYSEYKALQLPKRTYLGFLESQLVKNKIGSDISSLRLDLCNLLSNEEVYDLDRVLHMLESEEASLLQFEKCIVYSRLGLDEKIIQTLCEDITDYPTAVSYCLTGKISGRPKSTLREAEKTVQNHLFSLLFHQLLKIKSEPTRMICIRQLLDQYGPRLDLNTVLKQSDDNWPVEMFQTYLVSMFRILLGSKNNSNIHRALLRSENDAASNELKLLKKSVGKLENVEASEKEEIQKQENKM